MFKRCVVLLALALATPLSAHADPEVGGGVALVMLGFMLLSFASCALSVGYFIYGGSSRKRVAWTIISAVLISCYLGAMALFFDDRIKYGFLRFHVELVKKGKWFLPVVDGLFLLYFLFAGYMLMKAWVDDVRS